MINIDLNKLNKLEQNIYETMINTVETDGNLNIVKASELCNVSSSKISKTVKKLGFKNYKEFIKFCKGEFIDANEESSSEELKRIVNYIDNFNHDMVEKFIDKISNFNKIVIYGLGPSFICSQYLEYKLRTCTNKTVLAINDKVQIKNVVDDNTLFIILSVTGKFSTFDDVCDIINEKQGEILILFEEYNQNRYNIKSDIMYLCKYKQNDSLAPYEKTRTVLFIFIEEVIQKLLEYSSNDNT